jgi:hypothetical protein
MELFFLWLLFSLGVAVAATSRGRNGVGWFFIAVFATPLIALILLLVFPSRRRDPNAPTPETHVRCPDCRELVLSDARKCKHCGTALVPQ